jgi:formamidopyrimidine-DNA glycosylase
MPELPEVETVCRGLAKVLIGARFVKVDAHRPDLRTPLPKNLAARLKGRCLQGIARRAKYILIELDKDETLVIHLGMSGRMVVSGKAGKPDAHDHLVFHFDNGLHVTFNDPRRFGLCDLVVTEDLPKHKLFRHLGIEPLGKALTPAFLAAKFKGKKTSMKTALLDQRLVVGVGNIYASEALFYAKISPNRRAGSCTKEQIARLVPAIRKVLNAAIKAGGSSLRDYVQADGELGYFQNHFAVYDREGKKCPGCTCDAKKTGGIQRIQQGGRSTFYCPAKQE